MKALVTMVLLYVSPCMADVEIMYTVNGHKIVLNEDGVTIDNKNFISYCNDGFNIGIGTNQHKNTVSVVSRGGKSCLAIKQEKYFRFTIVPIWETNNFLFCNDQIVLLDNFGKLFRPANKEDETKVIETIGGLFCGPNGNPYNIAELKARIGAPLGNLPASPKGEVTVKRGEECPDELFRNVEDLQYSATCFPRNSNSATKVLSGGPAPH